MIIIIMNIINVYSLLIYQSFAIAFNGIYWDGTIVRGHLRRGDGVQAEGVADAGDFPPLAADLSSGVGVFNQRVSDARQIHAVRRRRRQRRRVHG